MGVNVPAYELNRESSVTAREMVSARFSGRVPETVLLSFHYNAAIFKKLAMRYRAMKCGWYRDDFYPFLLRGTHKGWYVLPGTGAPALMYDLENLRACGAKKFVLFGKAGFLKEARANLVMPKLSYVDEGTSYHYISHGGGIESNSSLSADVQNILEDAGFIVSNDPVWTTDAIYRETPGRIEHFRKKGCLCVDMETSALFSFCRRYGLEGASILYKSDSFFQDKWAYHGADFNSEKITDEKTIALLIDGI